MCLDFPCPASRGRNGEAQLLFGSLVVVGLPIIMTLYIHGGSDGLFPVEKSKTTNIYLNTTFKWKGNF